MKIWTISIVESKSYRSLTEVKEVKYDFTNFTEIHSSKLLVLIILANENSFRAKKIWNSVHRCFPAFALWFLWALWSFYLAVYFVFASVCLSLLTNLVFMNVSACLAGCVCSCVVCCFRAVIEYGKFHCTCMILLVCAPVPCFSFIFFVQFLECLLCGLYMLFLALCILVANYLSFLFFFSI